MYVRLDTADNSAESWALRPNVGKGHVRVNDHWHMQIAWAQADPKTGGVSVCVRSRFREDPMMTVPKWLLSYVMDKQLPRAVATLRKVTIEYDKRAMAAAAQPPPEQQQQQQPQQHTTAEKEKQSAKRRGGAQQLSLSPGGESSHFGSVTV